MGIAVQVAYMLFERLSRSLELDDDRGPFLREQGNIRPLSPVLVDSFREDRLQRGVNVGLKDCVTVVPSDARQRHIGCDVVIVLLFLAQQPDIMVLQRRF